MSWVSRPSSSKSITTNAKKELPAPLKLNRNEALKQENLINEYLNGMPENSMLFQAEPKSDMRLNVVAD